MFFRLTQFAALMIVICVGRLSAADDARKPASKTFDNAVARLLSQRCLDCHNGTDRKGGLDLSQQKTAIKGGESGPAIVPGRLNMSVLWDRVTADEMPPEKPLTAAEKETLSAWIKSGAKWGTDPIDRFRDTTATRAGYDWWSLKPLKRPDVPEISPKATEQTHNPIDAFIQMRLEQQRLTLSPAADKQTLIRRATFDLIGLPPSPADVESFLNDTAPDAYERLVDRLLASPHYGERWARHWLDIVRFGESEGFERDKLRPHAWRYRDWVASAFNDDTPYDEFARRQLAGDVLHPNDPAATIATGFLVAGPYDVVGQNQQSAAMRAVVRQDELEDLVSVVGQSFLGLTINCARCHDHKFDPVRQEEYYRLTAALAGVRHGERNIDSKELKTHAVGRAESLQARIRILKLQNQQLESTARREILAKRRVKSTATPVSVPPPIARWEFEKDLKDSVGRLHGKGHGKAEVRDGYLVTDGKTGYVATAALDRDITERTLEAWVKLNNLDQRGGGVVSLQTLDGIQFDAIVFGEQQPRHWLAGSNNFKRTKSFAGAAESADGNTLIHVAIAYDKQGRISAFRNGQPYGKPYKSSGPHTFKAGQSRLLFGLRHSPPSGNRFLAAKFDKMQLYDQALTPAEVAASAGVADDFVSEEELLARLTPTARQARKQRMFEIDRLESQRVRATTMKTYSVTPRKPGKTHLLKRGNTTQIGKVVTPGGVAALPGLDAEFHLDSDTPDADRRIALARWVTHKQNPLFARVIVNRLWHYHFGSGLVQTPSDFGFNGGRPSHPQLIDYLAAELLHHRGRLKAIQRAIVTSATYRQSSHSNPAAAEIDAGNRLLWRKSPTRLEAEVLRDAILLTAGQLNRTMGGPGYEDFTTFTRNTQFYEPLDAVGHSFHRRSLYRTWVRSGRNRFLDAFDCPDPSTKTPRRAVTTTPLQALSLLNNSFVLRMSDRFAERLKSEAGDDKQQQVNLAFQLAYGRTVTPNELQLTTGFIEQHGLSAFCRVLFNSNEFLHVD